MSETLVDLAMAKKRDKTPDEGRRPVVLTMKGTPDYKAWLQRAADHCGLSVTSMVTMAVRRYVKGQGFEEPPPKR